jgi:hypothetical protein
MQRKLNDLPLFFDRCLVFDFFSSATAADASSTSKQASGYKQQITSSIVHWF